MKRNQHGYVTLLLVVLTVFGFFLSGGAISLTQPKSESTVVKVFDSVASKSADQTLQIKPLDSSTEE